MAGIKLSVTGKAKASSIVEVVISMVVIVIVFGIAMGIFANVQRLSLSAQKVHAQAILKEELIKTEQEPHISKQTNNVDGFEVSSEVTPYQDHADLYLIALAAFDNNGKKMAELREVVYAK